MATNVTLTMSELIDEVLEQLYRQSERPYQAAFGSDGLTGSAADVTFTLTNFVNFSVTDVIEAGSELILITAKTVDADPIFTGARAYLGTTVAAHVAGDTVLKNPEWNRTKIQRYIERFYKGPANTYIPNITSSSLNREDDLQYVALAATVIKVLEVRHYNAQTGRIIDLGGWRFEENLPVAEFSTTKALRVSSAVGNDDDLIVTYQTAYTWSVTPPTEAATISSPLGSEDLPVLWTAAYCVTRHEVTRMELDKVEEWNQEQATKLGVNLRMVNTLWGEFYRRLDEVRKVQYIPRTRPYRKMPRL